MVPLARWLVRGSGAVGVPVVVLCGRCSSSSAPSVIGGVVVVYVVAGRSLAFVGQLFVGCWPSLSPLRAVIEVLGGWRRFGWLDLFVVVWVV